ncbi:hypothetical protein CBQ28_10585 [Pseudoalteromonas sp. GCY]|uniref:YajG family lipoprotein n=1 Tax=Pseudoalteromonas sp. GCY TaxID=2003316 RepID=UPI000BFEC189|nr:YajG family lipoprotein [Pseudoalteromonas sp. GCY]PHI37104.1 hypothetical protein CBQ28_10585 [Pseudoalteromonas sp. GCY]QQQ66457.1 hypothetical protein JJQ94_19590 [Pseudoalteromonas sp. GCY]
MRFSLLIILLTLILVGCESSPRSVILHPEYQGPSSNALAANVAVEVNDLRTTKYTIRVKNQEPALYVPDANLPVNFNQVLTQALTAHGAQITPAAAAQITVNINRFKAIIDESFSTHQSDAEADVTVLIKQGSRSFEKQYKGSANLNGPLKHDQAKIEEQLNNLAQQVVTRIVQDPEFIQFVRGS